MKIDNRAFWLPFALAAFAIAQPVYDLLSATPEFLLARQNTRLDVWLLTLFLSLVLPGMLVAPAWLMRNRLPRFSATYLFILSATLAAVLAALFLKNHLESQIPLYIGASVLIGILVTWILLKTQLRMMVLPLLLMGFIFPLLFVFYSPVLGTLKGIPQNSGTVSFQPENPADVVFLLLDELPVASLMDENHQIDKELFPNFYRLQQMSDWYVNTTSVSDGTVNAVPAILTGLYPEEGHAKITIAEQPFSLFTLLQQYYDYNVVEIVTRFCPRSKCPVVGPSHRARFRALLLDLTAVYAHQLAPAAWTIHLPNVSDNWSGFFAEQQVFFPSGWLEEAEGHTVTDRPTLMRTFIDSIKAGDQPRLNFLHILFPHAPYAYFPNGENYGREWMRGLRDERWQDSEWGVVSGKQRHILQVQYADVLMGELLDHLENSNLLDSSLLIVLSDHGATFKVNDRRRALTGDNYAEMLRIPLFIKRPGQQEGRYRQTPAMSIDVLPTLLAELGMPVEALNLDGQPLDTVPELEARERKASSYENRQLQTLDEASLDVVDIIRQNRVDLKLDEADQAFWSLGPYDHLIGEPLESLCTPTTADIRYHRYKLNPLPGTNAEAIYAYVNGKVEGPALKAAPMPFVVTSHGVIAGSGWTWDFEDGALYFTLVKPELAKQSDWSPEPWMVDEDRCLTRRAQP